MIWALLAILGVPIWLVVGLLAGALVTRRRITSQPDVVRLKLRGVTDDRWPRRVAYGRMVRDVLVVHRGLALVRCTIRGVATAVHRTDLGPVVPFERPRVMELTFDDGSTVLLAFEHADAPRFAVLESVGGHH